MGAVPLPLSLPLPLTQDSLADRMLREWVRAHLLPGQPPPRPSNLVKQPAKLEAGTILCTRVAPATGRASDRALLRDQLP